MINTEPTAIKTLESELLDIQTRERQAWVLTSGFVVLAVAALFITVLTMPLAAGFPLGFLSVLTLIKILCVGTEELDVCYTLRKPRQKALEILKQSPELQDELQLHTLSGELIVKEVNPKRMDGWLHTEDLSILSDTPKKKSKMCLRQPDEFGSPV